MKLAKSKTQVRKKKAAVMAESRWRTENSVKPCQCRVADKITKDASTQTENVYLVSVSPSSTKAVCEVTEDVSGITASTNTSTSTPIYAKLPGDSGETGQLKCLDSSAISKCMDAIEIPPLSQESVESAATAGSVPEPALSSMKASLLREVDKHLQNANHSPKNLTSNELATADGQLLLVTSNAVEKLAHSDLKDVKKCNCDNASYEFRSLKQITSEEFEFRCTQCGKTFPFTAGSAVVKAKTRPRSAIRNLVALSFLVNGQYFKDYERILGTLGLDHVCSTQWIHIIEWIAPYVKSIADWSVQEARNEVLRRGDKSSLHMQFDGFFLTRGHYSNNSSATVHDAKSGKIIAYAHRTKRGQGANWEGTSGGAEAGGRYAE